MAFIILYYDIVYIYIGIASISKRSGNTYCPVSFCWIAVSLKVMMVRIGRT